MLVKLPGESTFYLAKDSGTMASKMEFHCIAPTKLELKVDAQVMLLKNQNGGSSGLVNGSIGIVIGLTREAATNVRTGKDGKALPSLNKPGELLPKVRFVHDTGGHTDMVLGREEWTVEAPIARRVRVANGQEEEEYTTEVLGRRIQIPLCLAWAMSIHKSQGQTLSKVKVDLGRVFEKGMFIDLLIIIIFLGI
jgi:ATP-dependent DNA helicase PIF1